MAFPASPTNGQVTVVNQVSYQYSSATNSWTRILSTANVITANTIAVNGALTVGTTISAVGNITAGSGNFFIGNGSQLTGVAASSAGFPISSGNSNIAATANGNIFISVAGTSNVAVFATTGEYITGVLSASGTITGGNLATGGTASATGNITGGNILTGGLISATGTVTGSSFLGAVVSVTANVTGGNVLTGGLISATSTITSAANVTGGNLLTGGLISATGNITAGNANIIGTTASTSKTTGALTVGGGIGVAGDLYAGNSITVDGGSYGNVTTTQFASVFATGAGANPRSIMQVRGADGVAGIGIQGTSGGPGQVYANTSIDFTTGATIRDKDYPTGGATRATLDSTGFLANGIVSASGNVTGGNVLTAGLVSATGNVTGNYILGNGYFLTGVITSVANINNGTSNVNIAAANANVTVSVNGTSNVAVFATTGEYITGELSASGNVTGGNVLTAGLISATSTITSAANITGGNVLTGGLISATANVTGGNLLTGGLISATSTITSAANITGGNVLTAGLISATSTITSAANITGGNVLTGGLVSATGTVTGSSFIGAVVTASGNVVGGNILTAGLISATGNVTGGNLLSSVVYGATNLTITAASGNITLNPTGNVLMSSRNINNLADPVADQDAATKVYVDNIAQGLDPKASVVYATTANLAPYTYNNGTSGVGATITITATGNLTIDGSVVSVNERVLIKNEVSGNAPYNGIYVVTTAGAPGVAAILTRSADMNIWAEVPGAFTFVEAGAVNLDTGWVSTADATGTMGTTAITWTQFSAAGAYTANTSAGLSLIGSQFNAKVDGVTTAFDGGGNISVKTSANLTTPNIGVANGTSLAVSSFINAGTIVSAAGNITGGNILTGGLISATSTITSAANVTGGNLITGGVVSATANITGGNVLTAGLVSATGNVTGNFINGNGFFLTGIITSVANINNGTSNVNIASANANVTVSVDGTSNVAVFATTGEFITGVLSASGNVTGGNVLTAGLISATSTITSAANITGGNVLTGGLVSATANVTGGNILTAGLISATSTITSAANITGGNLLTAGLISATSTITSAANITGGNLLTAGLISATSTITSAANITGGNILTGGLVSATANVTGGNILTAGLISATSTITSAANITGGNVLTAGLVSATGNVTGGNILTAGIISATGNIRGGNVTATNYYYANGVAIINYTASTTPPASPSTGWQWYNTTTDVLYEYITDGTTPYWVDISSPAFAGGVVANVSISGNILNNANATYDIGSSVQTFANVYAQNYYGNGASLSGIITSVSNINNGTSNVTVNGSGGNVTTSVGGTANVGVFYSGGLSITGDLTVTGNATLTGNIVADRIQNGTTLIDIQSANGNANVTIGGTSNVAVFATTGVFVTGVNSVSGNVTGGNILTGGLISATGNITGGNLTVSTGTVTVGNIVNANGNAVGNIGSTSNYFNTIFGKATTAQYADLAENYLGDAVYTPGTVLDFDGTQEVTLSTHDSSKRVAGVVSTNPAHLMNSTLDGAHVTAVALAGRVPTQVTGTIAKGDLMVSAGNGRARAEANPAVGTVIGKALENFDGGEGTIEIVISMQ